MASGPLIGGDAPRTAVKALKPESKRRRRRQRPAAAAATRGGRGGNGLRGPVFRGGGPALNTDTCLTFADPAPRPREGAAIELLATRDPSDRAHGVTGHLRGEHGFMVGLLPACRVDRRGVARGLPLAGSLPRRYPRAALNLAGVSVDTAAEHLAAAQDRAGLETLVVGRVSPVAAAAVDALGKLAAREQWDDDGVRRFVRRGQRTAHARGGDDDEGAAHRLGTELLRAARLGEWGEGTGR